MFAACNKNNGEVPETRDELYGIKREGMWYRNHCDAAVLKKHYFVVRLIKKECIW